MEGRIIRIISDQYQTIDNNKNIYNCICLGRIRLQKKPKVGDFVIFNIYEDKYAIEKIKSRKNELVRPPLANIDYTVIVMSAAEPDFSPVLVDRLIFLSSYANIIPIIYITKMDLIQEDNIIYNYINDYKNSGYQLFIGNKNKLDASFLDFINKKVCVLMGQSGVGKSSLMNLIYPHYKLKTQEISKALNRGKHTTRHSQLYLVNDGLLADTPGFSALEFKDIDLSIMKDCIIDFRNHINKCKFNDCLHINEPDCAIKNAVSEGLISSIRYNNYKELVNIVLKGDKLL